MKVEVNISDTLSPALAKLGRDFSHTDDLLFDIAVDIRDLTKDACLNPALRPRAWTPLNPDYAKWKQKHYGRSVADLVLEGRLYDSISARKTAPNESEVSTNVEYAEIHQLGGTAGRGAKIPARPYFPIINGQLTPRAKDIIYSRIESWLTRKLDGR